MWQPLTEFPAYSEMIFSIDNYLVFPNKSSLYHHQQNAYELVNLRGFKFSTSYKNRIFQCMDHIFCLQFQKFPVKFHKKYLIRTFENV